MLILAGRCQAGAANFSNATQSDDMDASTFQSTLPSDDESLPKLLKGRPAALGPALASHQPGRVWLVVLCCVVVTAIPYLLCCVEIGNKARCSGELVPLHGVVSVVSLRSGVVQAVHVAEGQQVAAGQALFVMSSEQHNGAVWRSGVSFPQQLQTRIASLHDDDLLLQQHASARIASLTRRVETLRVARDQLSRQVTLQNERIAASERLMARYSDLAVQHFVAAAQLDARQAELIELRQRLADLRHSLAMATADIAEVDDAIAVVRHQTARERAALQRSLAGLQQELIAAEDQREWVVRAGRDGVVTSVVATHGQPVDAAQPMAVLTGANEELVAEAYAPPQMIGQMRRGMPVALRYRAFPYQQFGQYQATVEQLEGVPVHMLNGSAASLDRLSGQAGQPLYRIRLRLRGQFVQGGGRAIALRPGMQFDASVELERRRLIDWVFDPLFRAADRQRAALG